MSTAEDHAAIPTYLKAHGPLMGIAFVLVFPLGAWIVRLSKVTVWVHASIQLLGWMMMLAGLALGIRLGRLTDLPSNNAHTILGTLVVLFLFFQPLLGYVHHLRFRKLQKQTKWTLMHTWNGRVAVLLGMLNGGLGLRLANNTTSGEIGYGVVAGVSGAAYLALIVWTDVARRKEDGDSKDDIPMTDREAVESGRAGVE
ncbi:DOMON domain-containing protein frrs1L [Vermiconidia calcicola]|uniref:DOMON domain-containing protein frrs1L n=1 Tax=Vermiconidia calcicola TaxID=1690605 RepID=A0ACC3NRB4_9PEZI|nr:DOMON domain-containing protein frrs1L [Vermiconidia calcicola]